MGDGLGTGAVAVAEEGVGFEEGIDWANRVEVTLCFNRSRVWLATPYFYVFPKESQSP